MTSTAHRAPPLLKKILQFWGISHHGALPALLCTMDKKSSKTIPKPVNSTVLSYHRIQILTGIVISSTIWCIEIHTATPSIAYGNIVCRVKILLRYFEPQSTVCHTANNNKDVFRGHWHTKTRIKTTIVHVALPLHNKELHLLPQPSIPKGWTYAWQRHPNMRVFEQFYWLCTLCCTLQTTTRTCSEVMDIQKHISKQQLLMLPFYFTTRNSTCCHNLPYPKVDQMVAIGIQIW